jgi:protein-disulfide isomerase
MKTRTCWTAIVAGSFLLAATLPAWAGAPAVAPPRGTKEGQTKKTDGKQPVALVAGQAITRDELRTAAAAQLRAVHRQEYEIETKVLDELIRQKLLEEAAKKQGVSTEKLLEQEVDGKVAEPTDAELLSYYLARKDRLDRPFEQVKPQLRQALKQAKIQYARETYLDGLRARADVVVLLSPPRVDVAYDPARLRGSPAAPVKIVEFSDFQCPYCRREEAVVRDLLKKYPAEVALGYRDFPLREIHPLAQQAAEASRCAAEQGKYWEYHDALMAGKLDTASLKQDARDLKLDEKQFDSCLAARKYAAAIDRDRSDGEGAGVTGTPGFFVNGIPVDGAQPEETFTRIIDREIAREKAGAKH